MLINVLKSSGAAGSSGRPRVGGRGQDALDRDGDLQYWMDENYIYGCFANTGEVRVPIRCEIPASRSIDLM